MEHLSNNNNALQGQIVCVFDDADEHGDVGLESVIELEHEMVDHSNNTKVATSTLVTNAVENREISCRCCNWASCGVVFCLNSTTDQIPLLLQCGHSCCAWCVQHLDSVVREVSGDVFWFVQCPACDQRTWTKVTTVGGEVQSIELAVNASLVGLLDRRQHKIGEMEEAEAEAKDVERHDQHDQEHMRERQAVLRSSIAEVMSVVEELDSVMREGMDKVQQMVGELVADLKSKHRAERMKLMQQLAELSREKSAVDAMMMMEQEQDQGLIQDQQQQQQQQEDGDDERCDAVMDGDSSVACVACVGHEETEASSTSQSCHHLHLACVMELVGSLCMATQHVLTALESVRGNSCDENQNHVTASKQIMQFKSLSSRSISQVTTTHITR
jgi:hypothetical protein